MDMNKLYRTELKAALRLQKWVDGHPYVTDTFVALAGILGVLGVIFL